MGHGCHRLKHGMPHEMRRAAETSEVAERLGATVDRNEPDGLDADDGRVDAALAELRHALDSARPEDRAFALDCLKDLARRFDAGRLE